jgi:MerR HTH family regulatory protein
VQPAFVRRLDSEGVVCPARSAGGLRRYRRTELNHIAALAGLMGEGVRVTGETVRNRSEPVLRILGLSGVLDVMTDERQTPGDSGRVAEG